MSRRDGPQFSSYLVKGPVFARFTLPDKVAGSVIGRAGQVLQEFEQSSGAQIKVSPSKVYFPSTNERTIIITGEQHQVRMGVPFLVHKLNEHGHDERSVLLKMIVPNGSIPSIIGKGGEVVRHITSRTGATIHLCDKIEGISETLLEVKGENRSVIDAATEIIDIIQGDPKLKEIAGEYYASFQPPRGAASQRQDWQDTYSRREDRRDNYPSRDEQRPGSSYHRRDERRDEWQDQSYQRQDDRSEPYHRRDEPYPPRREDAYPPRREEAYPPRREEAYPPRREEAYPPRREEAYPPRREEAYPPRREEAYPPRREEAYPPRREEAYPPRRDDAYPPRREEPAPPPRAPQYAPPPMTDPTTNPALLVYPMAIEFVVPVSSINYILGENGAHVEHVFNSTGAEVTVSSEPDSIDANVRISGPLSGVQAAHILVIKQVADALMAESAA